MDTKYVLGITEIDAQHEKLLTVIDELHKNVGLNRITPNEFTQVHNFLVDYAKEHFASEERLMRKYNFPYTKEHVAMHEWFVGFTGNLVMSPDSDVRALAFDALIKLNSWLVNHIMKADAVFVKHVLLCDPSLATQT